ncbi:MAG: hypothetical protein WC250_00855 [Candidatus Paceibacterota bacterium]|jgi:hypothetical protein
MKKFIIGASIWALPALALAQATNNAFDLLALISKILNAIVPVLIAFAVVYFLYGVFSYVFTDDEEKKEKAKEVMIYGVIGIFVMVSVWGLVNILAGTLNLNQQAPTSGIPNFQTQLPVTR